MSENFSRPKAIVIGGGIGGLSTAYLLQGKADVTLIEASSRWGGVIQTTRQDGFTMEAGPDCFISEKPAGLKLATDLGLEDQLIGTQPKYRQSFILTGKKLLPVPQGFYLMAPKSIPQFALSPIMSWSGKLRALDDLWLPARKSPGDESLSSFVIRRFGQEMLDCVAQPMIAGIYTANPYNLSLKATMPRFLELEQKFGSVIKGLQQNKSKDGSSGPRYGLFVSFRNGMDTLVNALTDKLKSTTLLLNTKIDGIERTTSGGWRVSLKNGEKLESNLLFLSLPAHKSSELLVHHFPTLAGRLSGIEYASSGTLNVVYKADQVKNSMDGMGFVIPYNEKRNLVACSFTFRKFENRCPEGFVLLRAFFGGAMQEEMLQKNNDEELATLIHQDLADILSIKGNPVKTHMSRWSQSMAQYTLGHIDRVESIEKELEQIPNLHLVGNGYRGVGIPDVIASAERAVQKAFP